MMGQQDEKIGWGSLLVSVESKGKVAHFFRLPVGPRAVAGIQKAFQNGFRVITGQRRPFPALHRTAKWFYLFIMRWKYGTSNDSGSCCGEFSFGRWHRPVRVAALTMMLGSLAAGANAHTISIEMAYISDAGGAPDDGLTRQNVDALAKPEDQPNSEPPSDDNYPPPSAPHHKGVTWRHYHHRTQHQVARTTSNRDSKEVVESSSASAHGQSHSRPWLKAKLIAFTTWWNGWSERNFHTRKLDVNIK